MQQDPNDRPPTHSIESKAISARTPAQWGTGELDHSGQHSGFARPPTSSFSGGEFSLAALVRHKWMILCLFSVVSAATVPWIWLYGSVEYRASAVVRVSPVVSRIVFKTEDNGLVPLYKSYLNTQVSIIRSPTVLQRVLDREEIRQTRWYHKQPSRFSMLLHDAPSQLERLQKELIVRPRRDTELIDVALLTFHPSEAKLIVDTVVEEFKKFSDETLRETDIVRMQTLLAQQETLRKEVDGLIATKFQLAKPLGTTDPEQLRSQLSTHLASLNADYEQLERVLKLAHWDVEVLNADDIQAKLDGGATADQEAATQATSSERTQIQLVQDVEWRRLNIQLRTSRHELHVARNQFGDSHPRIQEHQARVDYSEQLLSEREEQIRMNGPIGAGQAAELQGESRLTRDRTVLERDIARLEQQSQLLASQIERQRARVEEAGELAKEIAQYNQEISTKRDLYQTVRSRLTQLEMEGKAPARISVAAFAVKSSQPYRDRRLILSGMALALAFMTGIGVAYLRTMTDQRIREVRDVQQTVRVPFLGQLPEFPPGTSDHGQTNPLLQECARMLRTALLERISGTDKQVILITSSTSGAGKTTAALLLARSLAQLGKRTLLVEADLRRPALAGRINVKANQGLAAILTGSADDSVIAATDTANLDVLLAGDQPEKFNAELLANGVFAASLKRWRKSYDYVLLDSPPVLPVADARILAGQADGTIMILRSAQSRRPEVVQAYADLSAAGGTLLGTVLVGTDPSRGYSYYSGYGEYAPQLGA